MKTNKLIFATLFATICAALIFKLLYKDEPAPLEFSAQEGVTIVSPPIPFPDTAFTSHQGEPFSSRQLKGKWSLMFFGYTNCPDICPTTMADMNKASQSLTNPALNYLLVSLDPDRDDIDTLKEYVTYFNPDFIGLTGEEQAIKSFGETLGVFYAYEGDVASGSYTVAHYSAILLVDPEARLRAHIRPPHPPEKIIKAVTKIRDYYGD